MKKSLSIFLVIAMLLSMCTVVSAAEKITVDAKAPNAKNGTWIPESGAYIQVYTNSAGAGYAEYKVTVPETGKYNLKSNQRMNPEYQTELGDCELNVYVDYYKAATKTYTSREWNFVTTDLGDIVLSKGTNIIKFEVPQSGDLHIKEFYLEKTADLGNDDAQTIYSKNADLVSIEAGQDATGGMWSKGSKINFTYNAPFAGIYNISAVLNNFGRQEVSFSLGDKTVTLPADSATMKAYDFGNVTLDNAGENIISLISGGSAAATGDVEADYPRIHSIKITPVKRIAKITVDGPDYVGGTAGATDISGTLKLYGTQNAEYSIDAPETGKYKLSIRFRNQKYQSTAAIDPLNVYVNNGKVATAEIPHESFNEWNMSNMDAAVIVLYKGVNTLKFEVSAGNVLYIDEFVLETTDDVQDTPVVAPPMTVDGPDYVGGTAGATDISGTLKLYGTQNAEYDIETPVAGEYKLSIKFRNMPYQSAETLDPLNVYVDNNKVATAEIPHESFNEWNMSSMDIAVIELHEGVNKLKFEVSAGNILYIDEFYLEATEDLPEAPAMVITAGGADITESKQLADAFSGSVEVKYTPVDANPYFIIVAYYEDSRMISCAIATENDGVHTATLSGVTKGVNNKVKIFLWDTETTLIPYGPATEIR